MQFFADLLKMKTQVALTGNYTHRLAGAVFLIYLQKLDPVLLTKKTNTALVVLRNENMGLRSRVLDCFTHSCGNKLDKKNIGTVRKKLSVFETALSVFTVSVIFSCSACYVTKLQVGTLKISLPPLMTHAL